MTRPALVNWRLLLVTAAILAVAGVGVFALRNYQKHAATSAALAEGKAAFEKADWDSACSRLKRYLERNPDDVDILRMYGEARMSRRPLDLKQITEAIAAYRRILRLAPDDPVAFRQLTHVYWHARNYDDLAYISKQRLEQNRDDFDAAIWLAKVELNRGAKEAAGDALEALLKRIEAKKVTSPAYVEACNWLSFLAAERAGGELTEESRAWLDRAVGHDPKSVEALARRARFYRMKSVGAPDRDALLEAAQADLSRATAEQTDDPRLDLVLCSEWAAHGDIPRAEAAYQTALQATSAELKQKLIQPDDWIALKFMHGAELARRKNDIAWGVKLADEALAALPARNERASILPLAIELYLAAGKIDPAKQWLVDYLSVPTGQNDGPEAAETRALVEALVAEAENHHHRVVELLEPFRDRNPHRADVWKRLAVAYSRVGQRGRAIDMFTKYVRRESNDADALLMLGREQLAAQNYAAAAEISEQVTRLAPNSGAGGLLGLDAAVQAVLSNSAFGKQVDIGRLSESIHELREKNPKLIEARVFQASLAFREGRAEEAQSLLEAAIRECEEVLPAEVMLARLQVASGKGDQAVATLKTAISRDAQPVAPREILASLLEAQGKHDDACAVLADGVAAAPDADSRSYLTAKLATLELRSGRRDAALARLRALCAADPTDTRCRSLLLLQPELVSDANGAQKLIDEIKSAQGPSGTAWRLHQAAMWLRGPEWRGKQNAIQENLTYCVDADPAWPAPALLLGELLERIGNFAQAEATYRRVLSIQSRAFDVASRLLDLLERQKRFSDARALLDTIDAGARWMGEQRVALAINEGAFDDAIDELKQEIARSPENGVARVLLARLTYQSTKSADAALKLLDEAERLNADALALAGARAAIHHAEGDSELAVAALDSLVEHDGGLRPRLARAIFFESIGDPQRAEADYVALAEGENRADGAELLAQYHVKHNRLDDAVRGLEKAIAALPDSVRLQRMLMSALFARGKGDDRARAEKLLSMLSEGSVDDPQMLWTRALVAMDAKSPESLRTAEESLRKLIEIEPTAVEAYLRLIELLTRRGDYTAARDLAIRGRGVNPTNAKLLLARAECETRLGETGSALQLAQLALREAPGDPQALLVFASAAAQSGESGAMQRALEALSATTIDGPFATPLSIASATLMDRLGRRDAAIAQLRGSAANDPGAIDALVALAELHIKHAELGPAAEALDDAEQRVAGAASVTRLRLHLWMTAGEWDKIARVTDDLDPRDPAQAPLLVVAAGILANSGNSDRAKQAMPIFERVLSQNPASMDARLGLASAAYQAGELARAEQGYREALASEPSNARALNDLAWILAESTKKYDEALELASRGLRVAPDDLHLRDTRAFVLSKMPGRLSEARSEYERITQMAPAGSSSRARALLKCARLCVELKDWAAARRCLQEAAQLDARIRALSPAEKQELQELLTKTPQG